MWAQIELGVKTQVEEIRLGAGRISASHAFASLFVWKDEMQLTLWLEPDGFMVRQGSRGKNSYFFPCGSEKTKLNMLESLPCGAVLHYADAEDLAFLERTMPGRYQAVEARADWEYLYNKQAQIDLAGKNYSGLRWDVNRVRRLPGWEVTPIDHQTLPLTLALERQWQEICCSGGGVTDKEAAMAALEHFNELELVGVLATFMEEPVGYVLGGLLDQKTYFGTTLRAIKPIYYAALRWEINKALPSEITTINMEEDLGLEGLRQSKMMMRPDGFHEMFDVRL